MLRKGAVLLALAFSAGCGSSMPADKPESVQRHLVYEKVTGQAGIWIADVDGSRPRLLVREGASAVLSPNGKWVTYSWECADADDPGCTYVVPTTADAEQRLLANWAATVKWSPDSERIVTLQGPRGTQLVSIDVASGNAVELANGAFAGWSVSPDGKQVVFARSENAEGWVLGGKVDLFVVGIEGGDAMRITKSGDAAYPVWGPKSIAFARVVSCLEWPPPDGCTNNTWGRHEIWELQPDGSNRRPIVSPTPKRFHGQGYLGLIPLDWSDDGHALLAGWLNEWGRIPVAVDPATGDVRELAEDQASEGLALSRDGKLALVEVIDNVGSYPKSNTVLIAPYAGGKAQLVASGATGASWNR